MRELLDEFTDIIKNTEFFSTTERYGFQIFKIMLRLVDGSSLRIWEKRFKSSLQRYSFIGWMRWITRLLDGTTLLIIHR